ncbi:hypothetical protein N7470_010076 [Penicillium chermesinum]|nr:hypothetical protein N7470_010076 [Penicillium chermesinum]
MINRDSRGPFAKDVFINQGTKVRGSKTIRYRRSLNHKLCRLGIGRDSMMTRSAPYEKSKFLGSGGSMVARLKLKEIDGRAPQGVNADREAAVALRRTAARKGDVVVLETC